jgi:hypothetical protein
VYRKKGIATPTATPVSTDGTIETQVGSLPAATRAPELGRAHAKANQKPALSDEELRKRQATIGTRRKPDGPPREQRLLDDVADSDPSNEVGSGRK